MVKSVSKSDEKWIIIAISKKTSLPESGSGRPEIVYFPKSSIFDLESRAWYQIVQFDKKEGAVKSKLLSLQKQPS